MKKILIVFIVLAIMYMFLNSEEMPKPTYDNSIIFSITHAFLVDEASEQANIESQFGNGLYAPLFYSNFVGLDMDWKTNINSAGTGIQEFKDRMDEMIAYAESNGVGIHLTVTCGLARNVQYTEEAKQEDVRNAQWYNDNNISSSSQSADLPESGSHTIMDKSAEIIARKQASSSVVNKYVFGTFSRYARKLRGHMEAKFAAALEYSRQQQAAHPGVTIIFSAPGESELNYWQINESQYMQDSFCDYSPFAIAEFRDWVKHEGLYATGERYASQGYGSGGSRYQGGSGLSNFNSDFGTSFSSWNLKYYNWSLSDAVDTDYTDNSNPDPNIISVSQYTHGGMMPTSGSKHISGGFDAPRTMTESGVSAFYDLWENFRQQLVYHYIVDMAKIARDSGFPGNQYYSHQIPADYLFGTRPNDPAIPLLNPRYYSSASPLWTAYTYSDIGMGVTLYDINFGTSFARTTQYGITAVSDRSDNWAALEYNPEVIPSGVSATLSSVQTLYDEMIKLYNGTPHMISFFKWKGDQYQFKNTNRGTAAKQFFDAIKDKARGSISSMFVPKKVESFAGTYNSGSAKVDLSWSSKIWTDLNFNWPHWGDFKEFRIYRGYTSNFAANSSSLIASQTGYSYSDSGFSSGTTVYYKIAAVNDNSESGTTQTVSVTVPGGGTLNPILSVSRNKLSFAAISGGSNPPTQEFRVSNAGTGALNWTAADGAAWLTCTPDSSSAGATVTASVDISGLAVGTYSASISISAPNADNSPHSIVIMLTVKSASQDIAPFGDFSSPDDGSTVSSSIPVTGWVLDDMGVESVKIYRDATAGEGTGLIYIGDALFVEGARADIEAAYPDLPANYLAGWGYMMLSHFLPNGGNGTFTLHAIARDTTGNEVSLGTKTITVDNANATRPFGAIDTPAQGGSASGTGYWNAGWVLTPMSNMIPVDGSTINVYVNGVNMGHPQYNLSRPDIAGYFPTYANSAGAGGRLQIDTTAIGDGIHTISWVATDNAGNSDGIGSRFFTIQNSGSTDTAQTAAFKKTLVYNHTGLSKIPFDQSQPVDCIKGYGKSKLPVSPGKKGAINLEIKELERVEINLDSPGYLLGYLVVGNQFKALPSGSTLDTKKGVFYWQPGPGFIGSYTFDFFTAAAKDNHINSIKRKRVKINITPKFKK